MDFITLRLFDVLDILLVAFLLYYVYWRVKGTAAIHIFTGIVTIYLVWKLTEFLAMEMLSGLLGEFIAVGMFVLIVVFQEEIRKFLLMIGTTNFSARRNLLKQLNLIKVNPTQNSVQVDIIVEACQQLAITFTGALIVIRRNTSLDFIKNTGDLMEITVNTPIIESIFYKNSPLHDGAMLIEEDKITATRVILPVTREQKMPLRFGLRHRAAAGITEKTDALSLVVSEETGKISFIKNGEFIPYKNPDDLVLKIKKYLS